MSYLALSISSSSVACMVRRCFLANRLSIALCHLERMIVECISGLYGILSPLDLSFRNLVTQLIQYRHYRFVSPLDSLVCALILFFVIRVGVRAGRIANVNIVQNDPNLETLGIGRCSLISFAAPKARPFQLSADGSGVYWVGSFHGFDSFRYSFSIHLQSVPCQYLYPQVYNMNAMDSWLIRDLQNRIKALKEGKE